MITTIRSERPNDHGGINEVNRLSFERDNESRLIAKLRQADGFDRALSLVPVRDGRVAGHTLFSPIHTTKRIVGMFVCKKGIIAGSV